MSELPKGWVECKVGDLIKVKNGYSFKSTDYSKEGFPVIRISEITNSKIELKNAVRIPKTKANYNFQVNNGDLLIALSGATTGKVGVFNSGEIAFQNQRVGNFKILDENILIKGYRNYFIISKRKEIELAAYGGAQPNISASELERLSLPLAPLNEQKRIVEKLDKLLANVEEAKAHLEKIPVLIKRFRQSVLNAAVTGELTKDWRERNRIVEEWEEKKLKELCLEFTYGSSKKSQTKGKVPVLRMGNLQDGRIVWENLKYSSTQDEIRKYNLDKGDVLFNRTNSPELVGKTAIYRGEQPAIFAGYLIKIKTGENLNPEFLNISLNSVKSKEWCMQVKTDGVSQSNINAQKLSSYFILTPEIEEQKEIVKRVETLFKKADEIEERYRKAKQFVDKLTQSILAKAFRGELVPQDPNDQPASELLEKIKGGKAKQNNSKKKNKARRKR